MLSRRLLITSALVALLIAGTIFYVVNRRGGSAPAQPMTAGFLTAPTAAHPVSGSATRVYVNEKVVESVTASTAPDVARELIRSQAGVLKGSAKSGELFEFKAGSPHQLVMDTLTSHPAIQGLGESFTLNFHQEEGGVPVERSELMITLSADGRVTALGADVFPDIAMDLTPTVTGAQAARIMRTSAKSPANEPIEPVLVITPPTVPGGPYQLAWRAEVKVRTGTAGMPSQGGLRNDSTPSLMHVDALSGRILGTQSLLFNFALRANIRKELPTDPKVPMPLPGTTVLSGGNPVVTDASGEFTGAGPFTATLSGPAVAVFTSDDCEGTGRGDAVCTSTVPPLTGSGDLLWDGSEKLLGQLIAYHAVAAENAAVRSWGFTKLDGKRTLILTDYFDVQNGPSWSPESPPGYDSSIVIMDSFMGITQGQSYSDIIYHEYGHNIMYRDYTNIYPNKEGGAVSEGWADFMACTMNQDTKLQPLDAGVRGRKCNSTLMFNELNTLCGSNPACHTGGSVFSTAMYGALTTAGVDRDEFMTLVFRGLAQHKWTMRGFGEAVASAAQADGKTVIVDALKASFAARGITLAVAGSGGGGGGGGGATCGDSVITPPGEVCDGTNFGTKTCSSETGGAKTGGALRCESQCTSISSAFCTATTGGGGGALGTGTGGTGGPTTPGVKTIGNYKVYVPAGFNQANPIAFVMLLPGQGGTAQGTFDRGWKTIADRDTVLLASVNTSSDGILPEEVDAMYEALMDVPTKYNVAVNHISLWGFSAGAHLTYEIGLAYEGDNSNASFFNALAIQAGSLNLARQDGVYPPPPSTRRIPIFLHIGSNDTTVSIPGVRQDRVTLTADNYPVDYQEIAGQTHTFTVADVEAAWAFLKSKSLAAGTVQACATDGCTSLNSMRCTADASSVTTCQQKTEAGGPCLGLTATACIGGMTCTEQGADQASCTATGGGSSSSPPGGGGNSSSPAGGQSSSSPAGGGGNSSSPAGGGATCGDGTVSGDETCDDGNTTGGDGCSASCTTEGGTVPAGCGNGVLTADEFCDDGNVVEKDGCTAACVVERLYPTTVRAVLPDFTAGGDVGVPVAFDCRRSIGYGLSCAWDFGDGTNSLGKADYNNDRVVDIEDLRFFIAEVYGKRSTTAPAGTSFDVEGDGKVDILDVQAIIRQSTTHVVTHVYPAAMSSTVVLTVSGQNTRAVTVRDSKTGTLVISAGGGNGSALTASAGPDQNPEAGDDVNLVGSGRGGTPPYTFTWTQVRGNQTAILQDRSATVARFTMPRITGSDPLSFELSVRDSTGASATDRVDVWLRTGTGGNGGGGAGSACMLPEGKRIALLEINTRAYESLASVKPYQPANADDARDSAKVRTVVRDFLTPAGGDAGVDAKRRFVVGVGYGATSALIGGYGEPNVAGIIHVNQESVRACGTDTNCTTLQNVIAGVLAASSVRTPVALTWQKGIANKGVSTRAALEKAGLVLNKTLFILETVGVEPNEAERATLVEWMLAHPSDGSCPEPGPTSTAS